MQDADARCRVPDLRAEARMCTGMRLERQEIIEPSRFVVSPNLYLHKEVDHLNKFVFSAVVAGVAAGISLPFLVPPPKAEPTGGLDAQMKASLTEKKPSSAIVAEAKPLHARLAAEPVKPPSESTPMYHPSRRRRHRLSSRHMDQRLMRQMAEEDNRAWEAANRMLQQERATGV